MATEAPREKTGRQPQRAFQRMQILHDIPVLEGAPGPALWMLPSLPPLPTCPLLTELLCTETTIPQPLLVSVEEGPLG